MGDNEKEVDRALERALLGKAIPSFAEGQICFYRGKLCKIIRVLPYGTWVDKQVPEYEILFTSTSDSKRVAQKELEEKR